MVFPHTNFNLFLRNSAFCAEAFGDFAAGYCAGVKVAEHDADFTDILFAFRDFDLFKEVDALAGGTQFTVQQFMLDFQNLIGFTQRNGVFESLDRIVGTPIGIKKIPMDLLKLHLFKDR